MICRAPMNRKANLGKNWFGCKVEFKLNISARSCIDGSLRQEAESTSLETVSPESEVVDLRNGSYEIRWRGFAAGLYDTAILGCGVPLSPSFQFEVVAGKCCPRQCFATGEPIKHRKLIVGIPTTLTFIARDLYGNDILEERLEVAIRFTDQAGRMTRDDIMTRGRTTLGGRCQLTFMAPTLGEFLMHLLCLGEHIHGSPMGITGVAAIPGNGVLEVLGLGLWLAEAGVTASYRIKICPHYLGERGQTSQTTNSCQGPPVPGLRITPSLPRLSGPATSYEDILDPLIDNRGTCADMSSLAWTTPPIADSVSGRGVSVARCDPGCTQGTLAAPGDTRSHQGLDQGLAARQTEGRGAVAVKPVFYLVLACDNSSSEGGYEHDKVRENDRCCISLTGPCLDAQATADGHAVQILESCWRPGMGSVKISADPSEVLRVNGHVEHVGGPIYEIRFRATVAGLYKPTLLLDECPVNLGTCLTRVTHGDIHLPSTKVSGTGALKANAGVPAEMFLQLSDMFGNHITAGLNTFEVRMTQDESETGPAAATCTRVPKRRAMGCRRDACVFLKPISGRGALFKVEYIGWETGPYILDIWMDEGQQARSASRQHRILIEAGPTCPDRCSLAGQATSQVAAGDFAAFTILVCSFSVLLGQSKTAMSPSTVPKDTGSTTRYDLAHPSRNTSGALLWGNQEAASAYWYTKATFFLVNAQCTKKPLP
eukprot:jgi/Botrbrau1/1789/Bobra.0217s0044.1